MHEVGSLKAFSDEDLANLYSWCGVANYYAHQYDIAWFMDIWETLVGEVEDEICRRFCEVHGDEATVSK